jgi:probable F420-dependent oxidoreductase
VRIGLLLPNTWDGAVDSVRRLGPQAEAWGYDSIWVTDHVVGASYEPIYGPIWAEVLSSLAYLAGVTDRVRLGTSILVVPYRDPVYTAKVLTMIDTFSDGRLDIGVGTGWSRKEFDALGRAEFFDQRGPVTDEALEVMQRCWSGGEISHQGRFFSIPPVEFAPVPVQRPHPPLWIACLAGRSPERPATRISPSMRRVARFADVWHPAWMPPDMVKTVGDRLDEVAQRNVPRSIRVAIDPSQLDGALDLLHAYAQVGCVEAVVEFRPGENLATWTSAERLADLLERQGKP